MNNSSRIATLLFLKSRNEISAEEEAEIDAWRAKSPENEKACQDMGDPEYVRKMMADLYKGRDIVYDGMKVRFSYLSDSKLSSADDLETDEQRNDFPEKDIAESGLSKAAFWESLLSGLDLSDIKTSDKNEEQNGSVKQGKIVSIKKRSPRRYVRVLMWAASVVFLVFAIDFFQPASKYKNYQAEMISSDGVKTMINDFYRGFKAGLAGVKFGKTEKGEPIYIAADERKARNDKFYELITPPGGEFILQLPDGTLVWMNAASTIKYPANFEQDSIRIEVDGEAYIERSKDGSRQFLISPLSASANPSADKAHNARRITLNAEPSSSLNINTYSGSDQVFVTLIQGKADAKGESAEKDFHYTNGQQAVFVNDSLAITREVNTNEIISWKNGEFNFKGTTLPTMMPAIAKWYDVEVQYTSRIPDKKFNLQMSRSEPISKLLDNLTAQGLHITQQGNTITVWK
jgi:ferric-dicitrate binding protein FerR (iron transport regulator)